VQPDPLSVLLLSFLFFWFLFVGLLREMIWLPPVPSAPSGFVTGRPGPNAPDALCSSTQRRDPVLDTRDLVLVDDIGTGYYEAIAPRHKPDSGPRTPRGTRDAAAFRD